MFAPPLPNPLLPQNHPTEEDLSVHPVNKDPFTGTPCGDPGQRGRNGAPGTQQRDSEIGVAVPLQHSQG